MRWISVSLIISTSSYILTVTANKKGFANSCRVKRAGTWCGFQNIITLSTSWEYTAFGVYIHIVLLSMWLSWQGLWHTGGLSVGMGYLAHSSPSAWWCQRLIHLFLGWDGTQRQAICSSPQGLEAAADETNLINIDREMGGVPRSGRTVSNEVKSREPDTLSLVLVCTPPAFTKETRTVQESRRKNQSKRDGYCKLTLTWKG